MKHLPDIFSRIQQFNRMYGLPTPNRPIFEGVERLVRFREIISEEVKEADDILSKFVNKDTPEVELLTDLADWLGDMIVYCLSEGARAGLPMEMVLHTIMDSNFSKLGEDGQPIIVNGKVQKGPNYWKPEPKIKKLLEEILNHE